MIFHSYTLVSVSWLLVAAATAAYATFLARGRESLGRLGTLLAACALSAITLGLVLRALESGHWPLSNGYEFSLALLWSVLAAYLILERTMHSRATGAFGMGMALLVGSYPLFLVPAWAREARPLLPALRTVWMQLHVATGALAYGAFAVACGLSVLYLARDLKTWALASLPTPAAIDEFNYRALTLGYPWMSLVLITGAIWAQLAWGRYWSWDIKETWTLATWLVYTIVLHLRAVRGWRGKPIAALTILGFALVLFTFLGTGWLARRVGLSSLHLY
ncbi:MAG TPA: c-type cytochrome biogenesis protein CcsB [Anaerolineae bacterium]|nr:c-type cytochrome biogenesis protein CcsB [Anaerolineae bacterium]